MDYDVLILGGGIVGCAVAYELSKYNFNIALIEKNYDIVDDISFINTSVIYDGSETCNDVMATLEMGGSRLIKEACKKFNVEYKDVGALRVAYTTEEEKKIRELYDNSLKKGINDVSLLSKDEIKKIEPNLKDGYRMGMFSKNVSLINPYELAISYGEIAADNGVNFRFDEEVLSIEKNKKGFRVVTNKNKFSCRIVINTVLSDEDSQYKELNDSFRVMNYFIIDENMKNSLNNIIINESNEEEFVMNIPSLQGGNIVAVKDNSELTVQEKINRSRRIINDVDEKYLCINFTNKKNNLMVIDDSELKDGYIKVTGSHYAKVTLAPAIAKAITDTIAEQSSVTLKRDFVDRRRQFYKFKDMTNCERNELIALDKRYGNMICICNQVTEGEIVDSIRRPLGARTVEGVKKRTGAGLGNCFGTYCSRKIIKILAKEMDKMPTEIVEDSKESKIWVSRIKEFDEV
ncbi:NAD(P)/FAD-dependent oxidoreductase [Clostridium sp. HCP1S3_B4]|uniref:NAD(P)/FAD-dependent oxidoreductase n=1 Tax=unclassified Clostridium TaxID=2614128 RepID=UPI00168EC7C2|nr:FAD-dependent oxidoreductase [Clostridiales bacterium]MDY2730475.1 FAD-dependent oxidoreductase [Clostridium sp.]NLK22539.1 FAD-dependent oxidoreductase [Clostridiales bacterium]